MFQSNCSVRNVPIELFRVILNNLKKNVFLIIFQTEDLLRLHSQRCPSYNPEQKSIQLSLDGVSESKSTSISLDVYSSKFTNCRTVMPHRIVRPLNKYHIPYKPHFSKVLEDLRMNSCDLEDFIGDKPKRSQVTETKSHSSFYGCEFCFSKALRYSDLSEKKINDVKKKFEAQKKTVKERISFLQSMPDSDPEHVSIMKQVLKEIEAAEKIQTRKGRKTHNVWPENTKNGEPRTTFKILDIVNRIEQNTETLSADDVKGITGRSLLHDYPFFDFVNGVSCDYMHLVCLGVVKRMLELTFQVGETRERVTTRRLSPPSLFNIGMKSIKVFREFTRRARELDFAVLKAQELRNIILFFFPVVVQSIEKDAKERRLWFLLAFMVRSCVLPDEEFASIPITSIKSACDKFYLLFQQLFGEKNCSYSIHVVGAHLLNMRSKGPLTQTSAFIFEAFYGEMRHSFTPGTQSPLKQILQKVYMKRALSHHTCESSIYLSSKDTNLECNSLIYSFENKKYEMYKIENIDTEDKNMLYCRKQGRYNIQLNETPAIEWNKVGVFQEGALSSEIITLNRNQVAGKVLKVHSMLITCPNNVLREK